ncbi:MAG TPA: SDR family oxidoreductase [Solirubrobacteraceae bacterium]|nr:SDR family oxidoreductase [Solirubrobacteraceae bacterium]
MSTPGTQIEGAAALVTGGNRGFGRALVNELLTRGAAKVYATSRLPHPTRDERIVPLVLDVTDDESVAAAAHAAPDVSIVVNHAGLSLRTSILDSPFEDVRSELETNLFGTIRVARAFAPVLARHDSSALINVLSVLSWYATGSGYDVSKAAAWSATNSMRTRLHEQGTTVTAVHVGYMDTDMVADLDVPKTDPRDVAVQVADAILAGDFEVLADDLTRSVKSRLAQDITSMYPGLAQTVAASAA